MSQGVHPCRPGLVRVCVHFEHIATRSLQLELKPDVLLCVRLVLGEHSRALKVESALR
eukprot:CAMPEP_0205938934 /NCGR_PEP_ID=MMETSP1325-20131115/48219_1 /ASSEMBLY_ACC=CAM_ASM_000708 /TAXON_ID=236786 /ORGANISM="Florenciella sp., Strain RCC1007" /LENGTH=57 /DNA_ID=CAMNT_0053309327 /DNA_START=77 /DNA_END=246 /DNA_ORIENTATION=-